MRKRIQQLAKGKFEYAKPQLVLSEEEIRFEVYEGEVYEGEFTIETTTGSRIRGLVYVTNPRMEVLTSSFEGEKVRIRYQFHTNGLVEGLTEKGNFVIVCNQNEISLSFCASICKKYPKTSMGKIKDLDDFSCLAKDSWSEAFQLFYHRSFSNILKPDEIKENMIYRSMIATRPSNQNVEEFLVGIHKKEKINFQISQGSYECYDVKETRKEILEIKKNHWGYLEITVSSDAEFIHFSKKKIHSEDFIGSTYSYEFYIDVDKLHQGKNYACITMSSVYQTEYIQVMATAASENTKKEPSEHRQKKECLAKIMELYQAYRLKHIVTGDWAKKTIVLLEELHALEPREPMYVLMKAQCLIFNRQRQDAKWILDEFKRKWTNKKAPVWGYYLYIVSLIEKEPNYVDRLIHEIEVIFRERPDSVLLFWVLTFLKEEYIENNALKLKDLAYWIMKKSASPYLYIEAFYLIWQDPYLLRKMGDFEVRILRWAMRQNAINQDIAMQIFHIMENQKYFDTVHYDIMCAAYEVNPKPEYVGIICSYLIKNQKYDYKYHKWFAQGIELELRITSLYEAYLLSMDERRVEPVPKIIQMYFQYESSLPYKKMAVLYNNIIASKHSNADIYEKYRRAISRFAIEQIWAGHIDDNLAVIYDDILDLDIMNKEVAKALSHIIFTHKITIFDEKMIRAIIYQRQMKEPQIVSIVNKTAYVQLFSEEYVIVFEDENGQRYADSIHYQIENMMDVQKYLPKCMELAPAELPYLIAYFDKKQNYFAFEKEDKVYFPLLIFSDAVSHSYKARLLPEVLRFYKVSVYDVKIEEYLLKADYRRLDRESRKFAIELAVDNHLYDFAFDKIVEYGMDQLSSDAKRILASNMITKMQWEEEETLLTLAITAFRERKWDEKTLNYLCQYYSGPTDELLDIWFAAKEFDIDLFELSERLLVQMMYADYMVLDGLPVFSYFHEAGGEDFITLAYISDLAHRYFVEKQKIDEEIFELIEARYIYNLELNDACKLALLHYYADLSNVSKRQLAIEDELLGEYTRKNMHFAFYKHLAPELVLKYHLYDKVFLEYRTNPHSHVVLHYSRDEDGDTFLKEDMVDVYDGIFVKAFVVFFGEAIQYYISEEQGSQIDVTESNRIVNNDIYNKDDKSRYNLLNQMLISSTLQEEKELQMTMKQYAALHEVTKTEFTLL